MRGGRDAPPFLSPADAGPAAGTAERSPNIEDTGALRFLAASVLAAALLPALALPAAASGGIGCEIRDGQVSLDLAIGMTRGSGGFYSIDGTLALAAASLPADFRSLALDERLIHSWIDGGELKLHFYHEREAGAFMSLDLVIEAEAVEDGLYAGDYAVSVFGLAPSPGAETDTWSVTGTVVCLVE